MLVQLISLQVVEIPVLGEAEGVIMFGDLTQEQRRVVMAEFPERITDDPKLFFKRLQLRVSQEVFDNFTGTETLLENGKVGVLVDFDRDWYLEVCNRKVQRPNGGWAKYGYALHEAIKYRARQQGLRWSMTETDYGRRLVVY